MELDQDTYFVFGKVMQKYDIRLYYKLWKNRNIKTVFFLIQFLLLTFYKMGCGAVQNLQAS